MTWCCILISDHETSWALQATENSTFFSRRGRQFFRHVSKVTYNAAIFSIVYVKDCTRRLYLVYLMAHDMATERNDRKRYGVNSRRLPTLVEKCHTRITKHYILSESQSKVYNRISAAKQKIWKKNVKRLKKNRNYLPLFMKTVRSICVFHLMFLIRVFVQFLLFVVVEVINLWIRVVRYFFWTDRRPF